MWIIPALLILGAIALVKILKSGDVVDPGGDQLAEFDTASQRV